MRGRRERGAVCAGEICWGTERRQNGELVLINDIVDGHYVDSETYVDD